MTTLTRTADQAFSYTLRVQDGAGTLVTPTTTPTATMYTDSDRTSGAVVLTVTATAEPQIFTVTGPATAAGRRYLTHLITTSLGTREDEDDDILFSAIVGSIEDGSTTRDLIEETRRHLLSGAGEGLNQIADLDSTSTTVTLTRAMGDRLGAGTVLSVDLEVMRVWTANPAAGTAEVQRGYLGSTPSAHDAGTLVRVNPPHTDFAILKALNHELNALTGEGLYRMRTLDLTTSGTGVRTYDLADDVLSVYDVRVDHDDTANDWPGGLSWVWLPDLPASEFASGNALRIDSAVPSDRPLRVLYRAPFALLTALDDDVTSTGLPRSAWDIPPLGAAVRLTAPGEIERNQTRHQGDSRRAEEVPAGARMRSPLLLAQERDRRVARERANLARQWPSKSPR